MRSVLLLMSFKQIDLTDLTRRLFCRPDLHFGRRGRIGRETAEQRDARRERRRRAAAGEALRELSDFGFRTVVQGAGGRRE